MWSVHEPTPTHTHRHRLTHTYIHVYINIHTHTLSRLEYDAGNYYVSYLIITVVWGLLNVPNARLLKMLDCYFDILNCYLFDIRVLNDTVFLERKCIVNFHQLKSFLNFYYLKFITSVKISIKFERSINSWIIFWLKFLL